MQFPVMLLMMTRQIRMLTDSRRSAKCACDASIAFGDWRCNDLCLSSRALARFPSHKTHNFRLFGGQLATNIARTAAAALVRVIKLYGQQIDGKVKIGQANFSAEFWQMLLVIALLASETITPILSSSDARCLSASFSSSPFNAQQPERIVIFVASCAFSSQKSYSFASASTQPSIA